MSQVVHVVHRSREAYGVAQAKDIDEMRQEIRNVLTDVRRHFSMELGRSMETDIVRMMTGLG